MHMHHRADRLGVGAAWGCRHVVAACFTPSGQHPSQLLCLLTSPGLSLYSCSSRAFPLPLTLGSHRPQAKPENLLDTFILLMPPSQKSAADFARVCDLKVGTVPKGCIGGVGAQAKGCAR